MTVDTIKNVLMRIISINKNMSEDSLNNLLVASGWDQSDIREGINIYRAYRLSGSDSEAINEYKPTKIVNTVLADRGSLLSKEDDSKDKAPVISSKVEILEDASTVKDQNIISLMGDNKQGASAQNIDLMSALPNIKDLHLHGGSTNVDMIDDEKEKLKKEADVLTVHQSHIDSAELKGYNREPKSIFLVIVDVILFFMTLGLLMYVLFS